jgi:crotonobetainyl-CoA:carnitine CoA-transferase CaiB-like acyl-CoA transferase
MGERSPLAGVRVIEIGRFVTGPYCAQLLADLGAEVVKIEDPAGGDPFRMWNRGAAGGYGPPFLAFNRNKKSLTLDLKNPRGREVVKRLAAKADVFIENFRPGVADKLGIGFDALSAQNPRLVYCGITGMGRDGPYAGRPSYDIVGMGLSGLLGQLVDLKDPKVRGLALSDALTGLFASYGVLAALQGRERTGRGQRVDVNQLQATLALMHEPFATYFGSGQVLDNLERPKASNVFTFVCSDGKPIAIHLSSPTKFWHNFARAAGHAELIEDPRFKAHDARRRNHGAIVEALAPEFAKKPRAEWVHILEKADVPFAPIYTLDEVLEDPQAKHLGVVQKAVHPQKGEVKSLAYPFTLSDTPLGPVQAPATLGEHNDAILAEAGYSVGEIAELKSSGALSSSKTQEESA